MYGETLPSEASRGEGLVPVALLRLQVAAVRLHLTLAPLALALALALALTLAGFPRQKSFALHRSSRSRFGPGKCQSSLAPNEFAARAGLRASKPPKYPIPWRGPNA